MAHSVCRHKFIIIICFRDQNFKPQAGEHPKDCTCKFISSYPEVGLNRIWSSTDMLIATDWLNTFFAHLSHLHLITWKMFYYVKCKLQWLQFVFICIKIHCLQIRRLNRQFISTIFTILHWCLLLWCAFSY